LPVLRSDRRGGSAEDFEFIGIFHPGAQIFDFGFEAADLGRG
jgi:hypothetical protein